MLRPVLVLTLVAVALAGCGGRRYVPYYPPSGPPPPSAPNPRSVTPPPPPIDVIRPKVP